MTRPYQKSIVEKDGKFKFVLLEQRDEQRFSLCESAESTSVFNMSLTPIGVNYFENPTEHEYTARRQSLESEGWTFWGEAFAELPIATIS